MFLTSYVHLCYSSGLPSEESSEDLTRIADPDSRWTLIPRLPLQMIVEGNFFENGIAFFTRLVNTSISVRIASRDFCTQPAGGES